ncbi:hypothetical protein [Aneurinibacillus danicus]|uniref:Uncharacterized protein n=1 Tax=Aneurinibacillus danicus TaxID=267746 RepID=A0A511V843_9BACL|nr:hypothetical protein [Aneurinibacillus danicus]GEN35096.1 hypothetical protein ADA01nite_25560 [Aneurinibacillus danicus]
MHDHFDNIRRIQRLMERIPRLPDGQPLSISGWQIPLIEAARAQQWKVEQIRMALQSLPPGLNEWGRALEQIIRLPIDDDEEVELPQSIQEPLREVALELESYVPAIEKEWPSTLQANRPDSMQSVVVWATLISALFTIIGTTDSLLKNHPELLPAIQEKFTFVLRELFAHFSGTE